VVEVPSQVPGQLLFIGEGVPEWAISLTGVAPFMAEPYYYAVVRLGNEQHARFYRRLYEQEVVQAEQMLGLVDPAKTIGMVREKQAKLKAAIAEGKAAVAAEKEADIRFERARTLRDKGAISEEDYGSALVTAIKFREERVGKEEAVKVAQTDMLQAEIQLSQHEIHNRLAANRAIVKTILRQRGYAVKELEPIM